MFGGSQWCFPGAIFLLPTNILLVGQDVTSIKAGLRRVFNNLVWQAAADFYEDAHYFIAQVFY